MAVVERVLSLSWLSWRSSLAASPSEVIASSNTNTLSHRVFEREEASVCFVCETWNAYHCLHRREFISRLTLTPLPKAHTNSCLLCRPLLLK